ncbi:hypothetical protein OGH69_13490 [Flavobacterium sp. MFBS3-15]|uniref:hypothetical protein n=1 Tax=Flavobacterium sp. MFBS3-15 TaxID=2989816 RepID=UPI00223588BE|nr:hypothetical protein [Flavobacterium sp. MFBS3-15]MCW4469986.1 hypothetical protein [Flavobacterium sp. MFBS3-15]
MKKLLISIFAFGVLSLLLYNCSDSSDESSTSSIEASKFRKAGDPIIIGYVDSGSNYVVYTDSVRYIKQQWETNYNTTITDFSIEKTKTVASPEDPNDQGGNDVFLIVAKTSGGYRIAMAISKPSNNFLAPADPTFSVACSGCPQGCNIEPYGGNGRLKYRCADPCSTCTKTETLTNAPTPTN